MASDDVEHEGEVVAALTNRLHIYDALTRAAADLHGLVDVVAGASDRARAAEAVQQRFDLDQHQAWAVLDMQLVRLTVEDRAHLEGERQSMLAQLAEAQDTA